MGGYDVLVGAALCSRPDDMLELANLIRKLRSPVTVLVNHPIWSASATDVLKSYFAEQEGATVEERLMTLVSQDAKQQNATVRSCGVHRLLIVKQTALVGALGKSRE